MDQQGNGEAIDWHSSNFPLQNIHGLRQSCTKYRTTVDYHDLTVSYRKFQTPRPKSKKNCIFHIYFFMPIKAVIPYGGFQSYVLLYYNHFCISIVWCWRYSSMFTFKIKQTYTIIIVIMIIMHNKSTLKKLDQLVVDELRFPREQLPSYKCIPWNKDLLNTAIGTHIIVWC